MLRATGDTLEGQRPCDLFDVVMDERGDLSGLVLQDPPGRNMRRPPLEEALRAARRALLARAPLQDVVAAITAEAAHGGGTEIGVSLVRITPAEARVEVLNAGMPPIACASSDRIFLHPPLSPAIGRGPESCHAYEVVPLVWGSTWLLTSSGLTCGSSLPEAMLDVCRRLDLGARGVALASQSPQELRNAFIATRPNAVRCGRDDATLLLLAADPHARLESGIR